MPIYEFICKDCKTSFERICRMGCDTVPCEHCGSSNVEKKVSISAFKGSGREKSADSCHSSCSSRHCSTCSG